MTEPAAPEKHPVLPGAGVCWCVDRQVTWVFARGQMVKLTGVEQALWGWMTLSYSIEALTELLAELLQTCPVSARQQVEQTLALWLARGLLVEEN